jgi:GAF domain-containing protein
LALYRKSGDHLILEDLDGEEYRPFASLDIPLGMGLSGWVAENGKSIVNGNPSVEPGYLKDPARFGALRSALAVPLTAQDGVVGVLSLYRRDGDAFSAQALAALLSIAPAAARALELPAERSKISV